MATTTVGSSSMPTKMTDATSGAVYDIFSCAEWKIVDDFPSKVKTNQGGTNNQLKISQILTYEFRFVVTGTNRDAVNNTRKAIVYWFAHKTKVLVSHTIGGVDMIEWPSYSNQTLETFKGKIVHMEEMPTADFTSEFRLVFEYVT
jgi:hypothetical protein